MQKARRHPSRRNRAPTACRRMVSDSFNSPRRGSFHRSLALLDSLSVASKYLALGDGPPGFRPGSTCPALLGEPHGVCTTFEYGTVTLCGSAFQRILLIDRFVTPYVSPTTPPGKPDGLGMIPFRSPLLRESRLLSFPAATKMFQFTAFARRAYVFSTPQFGNPGINARLTASPGFSQPSTPFIANWRQDIPHTPLVTWPQ